MQGYELVDFLTASAPHWNNTNRTVTSAVQHTHRHTHIE